MASLIEQLQSEAVERSVPITDLLRKAKVAAIKLQRTDFASWVESELSGYGDKSDIPAYRHIHSDAKFLNPVHGWRPIIGSDHTINLSQSISEIWALLESDCTFFQCPVSPDYAKSIGRELGFAAEVQRHFPRSALISVVEAVRNAVLDWALKLEQAGIHGEGLSFSKKEADLAKGVTINIGSIGNATGIGTFGDHATITATQTMEASEMAKHVLDLVAKVEPLLASAGLVPSVQQEALTAIADLSDRARATAPDTGRLRSGLLILQQLMNSVDGNVIATGVTSLISQLLGG